MGRELRFRAWNRVAERYSKPFGLIYNVLNYTDDDGLGVIKSLTDETVEQFTSLLDKNGKEIYEGDIVRLGYKEPFKALEIRWVRDHYEFCKGNLELLPVQAPSTDQMEVIGNIHENPELL